MAGPQDFKAMRVKQFTTGQVWFVHYPARVVRVEEETSIDGVGPGDIPVAQPAIRLSVTLPTFVIPGIISPRQADENQHIKQSIVTACAKEDGDDSEWEEVWAERMVKPVRSHPRFGAPFVDDGAPSHPQLYVNEVIGVLGSRRRTTALNHAIEATRVDPAHVPAGLFRGDAVPVAETAPVPEPETVEPAVEPKLPTTYLALKKMAKDLSIDISDIHGPGTNKRIQERLELANACA